MGQVVGYKAMTMAIEKSQKVWHGYGCRQKFLPLWYRRILRHHGYRRGMIGITGTKGKTTTTYMVKSVLEKTGVKTGLIGTIETVIGDEHTPAANTTPESYIIQETFAKMVEAGCQCVVMEVSSQGLMLHRVSGFTFDYGIFTNLSEDHIGPTEHKDFPGLSPVQGHAVQTVPSRYCKRG